MNRLPKYSGLTLLYGLYVTVGLILSLNGLFEILRVVDGYYCCHLYFHLAYGFAFLFPGVVLLLVGIRDSFRNV